MKSMTVQSLKSAFAGESQAHMKYLIFADKAEGEGYSNLARLFRANAFAEQIHATNHLRELGEIKGSAENAQAAIEGETFEVEEMYPAYIAVAQAQGEKRAERTFQWAMEAEKVHAQLYGRAKEAAQGKRDVELGALYVCQVCGYTVEGEPPERCPVCSAKREKFRRF